MIMNDRIPFRERKLRNCLSLIFATNFKRSEANVRMSYLSNSLT